MRLTKARQARYRQQIADLERAAASYMEAYIDAFRESRPDASVAEIRDATILAIDDALNAFGEQASQVAAELFDEVCAKEGIDAEFEAVDAIDPEMVDQGVRYRARELVSGNDGKFKRDIADLTRFYVKRSAFESLAKSCDRNGIRYARVPSGTETCAFCFMLSSRGFVYHSELTAKGRNLHGMHKHCDCIIVPGIPGETVIEGYDPDAMYDRWRQCAETVGVDAKDASSYRYRQKIMDEMAKRDWRWLNSGKSAPVAYLKPKSELTGYERHGVDALARQGIAVIVNHEDPTAKANIDLTIGRNLVEMKNVTNESSVSNQVKRARTKWMKLGLDKAVRCVFTTQDSQVSFESLVDALRVRMRPGEEFIVIGQDGNLLRI